MFGRVEHVERVEVLDRINRIYRIGHQAGGGKVLEKRAVGDGNVRAEFA